jgi:hypothetical protein
MLYRLGVGGDNEAAITCVVGLVESALRRRGAAGAKAISVKAHTALLVFSLAFFVAPPVT